MNLLTGWRSRHREPKMPYPGQAMLRIRDVEVKFDEAVILSGICLDVFAGEVLALVGPNGAGKSTLLGAVTGDIDLTHGCVELDGRPIGTWNGPEMAMRRSVLLQEVGIAFSFTVEEVAEMGRAPWAGTSAEAQDEAVISGALARTKMHPFAKRKYTSLSGGERARAAFSRVLAQAAPVLLLDEPTAAMDIRHQELVMSLAREYASAGCAVVVVLHALDVAAAYADRIVLMSDGKIHSTGTPETVFTNQNLSEVYGHPIEVLKHPRSGALIVLPVRFQSPEESRDDE